MCGRVSEHNKPDDIAKHFGLRLEDIPPAKPRYNVAPSQDLLTIRSNPETHDREPVLLHWGLIPSWAKDSKIGYKMINARAETVDTKPAYRSAFKTRRCLLAVSGFYEWQRTDAKRKQPYHIKMKDGRVFSFGGLWERWEGKDGKVIESCTIITTTANTLMEPIHNRMPVIIQPKDYETWLDPKFNKPDDLREYLKPYAPHEMEAYPVSLLVNNPRNDSPECVKPL